MKKVSLSTVICGERGTHLTILAMFSHYKLLSNRIERENVGYILNRSATSQKRIRASERLEIALII
jgi:hypothetical protein